MYTLIINILTFNNLVYIYRFYWPWTFSLKLVLNNLFSSATLENSVKKFIEEYKSCCNTGQTNVIINSETSHLFMLLLYIFSQRNCDSYEVCANIVCLEAMLFGNAHCQRNYPSMHLHIQSCMEYVIFLSIKVVYICCGWQKYRL